MNKFSKAILVLITLFTLSNSTHAAYKAPEQNLEDQIAGTMATSMVYLVEIHEGQSASEACYENQMSCISVTTSKTFDKDLNFYGFTTPSCDSQVVRRDECEDNFGTHFALDHVLIKKSPKALSKEIMNGEHLCLSNKNGEEGIYRHAYCVKR